MSHAMHAVACSSTLALYGDVLQKQLRLFDRPKVRMQGGQKLAHCFVRLNFIKY